jgi:RNA polymerase sigma-70 factor (ECF subfamily)
VRRYQRPVISLIGKVLGERGDRATAEDLAQDTFVKAYLNLSAFDSTRRFSSWLFRIAHNTAIDAIRRSRAAVVVPHDSAEIESLSDAASAETIPDPAETAALGRALQEALGALRPEHRAAVMLRYEEGLSFEDIAHVLGVAEATARSFVHRARKQLAALLSESGWHP